MSERWSVYERVTDWGGVKVFRIASELTRREASAIVKARRAARTGVDVLFINYWCRPSAEEVAIGCIEETA